MPSDQARSLQEEGLSLEKDSIAGLDELHDAQLGGTLADGRTVRQALHELTDLYDEKLEQLLWTKWGQRLGRSEATRVSSDLQAARARFAAFLSGYNDDTVHVKTAAANNASARDIAAEVFDAERQTMDMVLRALQQQK